MPNPLYVLEAKFEIEGWVPLPEPIRARQGAVLAVETPEQGEAVLQHFSSYLIAKKCELRTAEYIRLDSAVSWGLQFADEQAEVILDSNSLNETIDGVRWYRLDSAADTNAPEDVVLQCVDYLEQRGLLVRHETDTMLVRIVTPEASHA